MFYQSDRLGLFMDGHNFYATAKKIELDVDYRHILTHFAGLARLRCAHYFTTLTQSDDHQPLRPLLDFMEFNGWSVTTKLAHEFIADDGGRKIKSDISVDLAICAAAMAPHLDHAVLFTGDSDFCPLVKFLQSNGTRVTIVSTLKHPMASNDLRRQADGFLELDALRPHIARKDRAAA